MSNKTEVINRALIKLGANTIASPSESSEQARRASMVFSSVARAELRRQAWNCAKARAVLSPLAVATGTPYFLYSYPLPSDCLRLLLFNGGMAIDTVRPISDSVDYFYTIEAGVVQTNEATADILYIKDISDSVGLWDSAFVDAYVCRLAAELAQSLTKSSQLSQSLRNEYRAAILEAKRCNAIELPAVSMPDSGWTISRYTRGV